MTLTLYDIGNTDSGNEFQSLAAQMKNVAAKRFGRTFEIFTMCGWCEAVFILRGKKVEFCGKKGQGK